MINKLKYFILIFIIIIFSLITFYIVINRNILKNYNWKMVGLTGQSQSIQESKALGTFICEVVGIEKEIIISDSSYFKIVSGWIEKTWKYPEILSTSMYENIDLENQYTIYLQLEIFNCNEYWEKWYLTTNSGRAFGLNNHTRSLLNVKLSHYNNFDSVIVFCINSPYQNKSRTQDTACWFYLIQKK